jgi:hypothetical protein
MSWMFVQNRCHNSYNYSYIYSVLTNVRDNHNGKTQRSTINQEGIMWKRSTFLKT